MVLVMLMLLFLALVSVGLWLYSRSLLTSAAAQGARFAANADVSDSQATQHTAALMAETLAGRSAGSIECSVGPHEGRLLEISCTMNAPGIVSLLDGVLPDIEVTAHTLDEATR